ATAGRSPRSTELRSLRLRPQRSGLSGQCSWGAGERARPLLGSLRARFLGGLDLVSEHRGGQRAGRLVFVDVLAIGLIALHEVALRSSESARPTQSDLNALGHDTAEILACSASAHVISSARPDLRARSLGGSFTIRHEPRGHNMSLWFFAA